MRFEAGTQATRAINYRGRDTWILGCIVLLGFIGLNRMIHADPQDPLGNQTRYQTFGAPARLEGKLLSLLEAIQSSNRGESIRVQAQVSSVCQVKGCWIVLTDGERTVRVTFKDYGFFVPKDISGRTVIVEGVISEKILSQELARHYAEDAGKSQEEIEKIVGDQKEYTMIAETVLVPQSTR